MKVTFLIGLLLATGSSAPVLSSPLAAGNAVPAAQFMAVLAQHCGQAFAGRVVTNVPASATDPFDGKALVMHVRGCQTPERELRVPFHVGEDRSRTCAHPRRRRPAPEARSPPRRWQSGCGDAVRRRHARRAAPRGRRSRSMLNGGDVRAHEARPARCAIRGRWRWSRGGASSMNFRARMAACSGWSST